MSFKTRYIGFEWFDAFLRLAFLCYMVMGVCQILAPVNFDLLDNELIEMTDNSGEQDSDELDQQLNDDIVELHLAIYVHIGAQLSLLGTVPSFASEHRDVFTPPPDV